MCKRGILKPTIAFSSGFIPVPYGSLRTVDCRHFVVWSQIWQQ